MRQIRRRFCRLAQEHVIPHSEGLIMRFWGWLILAVASSLCPAEPAERWSQEKANAWYAEKPWLIGCNFIPSTAINQLEMFQAETFDIETIDRELGWAENLGFDSIRVYLHNLLWEQDSKGFIKRADRFLDIADRHNIGVVFVLLDACWDPFPQLGKQRDPKPHVHNSGWVQSPGAEILKNPARHDELKPYIVGFVGRFRSDKRIHFWDIFNEPDNVNRSSYFEHEPQNKPELSLMLLKKAFAWAREANPKQPITAGVWVGDWSSDDKLSAPNRFMLENSDIITYHCYADLDRMKQFAEPLRRYNRPIICTEYMSRPVGSTFGAILPYMKDNKFGAYNWGLVAGKTQTIYPWASWTETFTEEPETWFHDIFRKDGRPFDPKEAELIRKLTGKTK